MQQCFAGDVDAGFATWAAIAAEHPRFSFPHLLAARWTMNDNPEGALVHFDKAIEAEPTDAGLYNRRGDCYAKMGDHERALANHRRALSLAPNSIDSLFAMGEALVAVGQPGEAIGYYDQAIARAPRYTDFYYSRAIALRVAGRHADALNDYDRMAALDPTNVTTRFGHAHCLCDMEGQEDRAIEELRALALEVPHEVEPHFYLGKMLRKQKQLAAANEALTRAIELAPDNANAIEERAHVRLELHDHPASIADWRRLLELSPDHLGAAISLQILLRAEKDFKGALEVIDGLIARMPDMEMFHNERAETLRLMGDNDQALKLLDDLAKSSGGDANTFVRRAQIVGGKQGRYAEAIESLDRAIELDPTHAKAFGLRANYREHIEGDEALIAADWQRALELNPNDFVNLYFRGRYFMNREKWGEALADFDRLVNITKDFADAIYQRAYARYRYIWDWEHAFKGDKAAKEQGKRELLLACAADNRRAWELEGKETGALFELSANLRDLEDLPGALEAIDRAIEADSLNCAFFSWRASLRKSMGDLEGAAEDNKRCDDVAAYWKEQQAAEGEASEPGA
jgi:tetratricopeptide (TPR) repeat protein